MANRPVDCRDVRTIYAIKDAFESLGYFDREIGCRWSIVWIAFDNKCPPVPPQAMATRGLGLELGLTEKDLGGRDLFPRPTANGKRCPNERNDGASKRGVEILNLV